jgi:hypothetical protein
MSRRLPSRRNVFLGAGAIASAALLPSLARAHAPVNTASPRQARKNIDDLTAAELEIYEHAVRLLLADSRSKVALHPVLRQAATLDPADAGRQWRQHHLEAIEAQLRATDPARTSRIVVPHWDFTKAPSGHQYPRAFERAGSPLFVGAHNGAPNHLDPVFWSYHAYIDTVWQAWETGHAPRAQRTTAHLWIGPNTVEIRTSTLSARTPPAMA